MPKPTSHATRSDREAHLDNVARSPSPASRRPGAATAAGPFSASPGAPEREYVAAGTVKLGTGSTQASGPTAAAVNKALAMSAWRRAARAVPRPVSTTSANVRIADERV